MRLPRSSRRTENASGQVVRASGRRGTLTLELILVLPILMLLLLAMMQFSLVLTARQQLMAASREGARVAARGGDANEVRCSVQRVLGGGSLSQAEVQCNVVPEDPTKPAEGREKVEVIVHVESTRVVPNFLAWIVKLEGQELVACTVMHRE